MIFMTHGNGSRASEAQEPSETSDKVVTFEKYSFFWVHKCLPIY